MAGETSQVDIVVRCAFQTGQDIKVSCPTQWTVKDLKEHLHTVCTLHPAVTSQRLIYAGACLTDAMIIQSIVDKRRFEGEPVFHLVCPLPQSSPVLTHRESGRNPTESSASSNTSNASLPSAQEWFNANFSRSSSYANLSNGSSMTADYAQAYQAYYGWYMNNYAQMLAYYQHMSSGLGVSVGTSATFPLINGGIGGQQQMLNDQGPQPQANVVQEDPDADVRAGGDYLDMIYKAFRVVLFLSVVLLYSTVERFLIVICIALFIFFIQLRRGQRRAAEAVGHPMHVNNNNNGEEGNGDQRQGEVVMGGELTGMQIFFSTCYSFITSFFTSLVPENPIPVNLN